MRTLQSTRRSHLVALLMALPALAGGLDLGTIETRRLVLLALPRQAASSPASLEDAIENASVEGAYAVIAAGHDPNEALGFSHPVLTGGRAIVSTPLLLAVAKRDRDMVSMFLGFGALADLPRTRLAACLADVLGDAEIARVIREAAAEKRKECPALESGAPPLESISVLAMKR
ncbi:MAG: hypothetical protein HY824_04890 [Acidobacteria bacterium]|nr:hypothetical protein [Acidobacteriota bacterium]